MRWDEFDSPARYVQLPEIKDAEELKTLHSAWEEETNASSKIHMANAICNTLHNFKLEEIDEDVDEDLGDPFEDWRVQW